MGMLGDYLDGLSDEQRDRVIRAQTWGWGGAPVGKDLFDLESKYFGCLVEHVHGSQRDATRVAAFGTIGSGRYDLLVARFGLPRVVRAIKKRAAQGMTTEALTERDGAGLPEPEVVVG